MLKDFLGGSGQGSQPRAELSSRARMGWPETGPGKSLSVIVFFLLLFAFQASAYAEKVRYVIDGDTFILQNNQRVRMIGINAPEVNNRRYKKKGQAHGRASKNYLKQLIEKKEVTLKGGGEDEFDRYGRRLSYVYLPDGTFVNLKMVEEGHAETYRKFPFEYKKDFLEMERRAQVTKRGMWTDKNPGWLDTILELLKS